MTMGWAMGNHMMYGLHQKGQMVTLVMAAIFYTMLAPGFAQSSAHDRDWVTCTKSSTTSEPDQVINGCSRVIARNSEPQQLKMALVQRGYAYAAKNQHSLAIDDFSRVIQQHPNDALGYMGRGSAYDGSGQHLKAIADYNRAIRLKPDEPYAYGSRGMAHKAMGEYDKAIADFTHALRLNIENPALTHALRGLSYERKRDIAKASADFQKSLQLDPNNRVALLGQARLQRTTDTQAQQRPGSEERFTEVVATLIMMPMPGMPSYIPARMARFQLSRSARLVRETSPSFGLTDRDVELIMANRPGSAVLVENAENRAILAKFLADLQAQGLQPVGKGSAWYSYRFRSP
ncbi:tetratricopeptide repeat protein [Belnapia sp. T6]|uniref:Tetratricopeptide repeat protein n=1 Tax=Belnapia mucosa TaxID=2804532 RepID=A0ABS1VEQ2_9PROT|nr:tetratricopeptide repeat protein [Belnapia mucosa]MBL6458873.1 tetratricopeptide repeat protein [Belnapia mucosa]